MDQTVSSTYRANNRVAKGEKMSSEFEMNPVVMQGIQGAQDGASALITGSYSAVTSEMLSNWSIVYGPLAVGNMIPALWQTMGSNFTSAIGTAFNHGLLSVATGVVDTTQVATDSITGV
jgi:hypothetical protein